ncbi:protein of unknown function [Methylocaldum szegediense]|uniref:Integrase n=1 Tax=Methylocaldum szegediense TaxID=73780 RepID=A0ABM9I0Y4_9GAMM|nr:protein of unknown function [Methylocaldum szegediense]
MAQQIGHKDWAMIRKVYGRWIPEVDPAAGHKIRQLLCDHPVTKRSPNLYPSRPNADSEKNWGNAGKPRV